VHICRIELIWVLVDEGGKGVYVSKVF